MAQNNDNNSNIGITPEQLEALLTRVVAAVKQPTELEQRKIDAENKQIEQDQANRKKVSQGVKEQMEGKKWTQRTCSHEHPRGDTHCVYIQEPIGPGYLLCQKNQCVIRPGVAAPNYKGTVIYDHALFNRIFQKLQSSGGDITG